ncbi:MAG TPA: transporter substrate-binding domain-containing protein [Alphaproteobacteria bacterium]|nr:transporter substrate-binding domain-containing protein [Alphaproteobacteria bacterium]
MRWPSLAAGIIGIAVAAGSVAADEPSLTILFHIRPPYSELGAPAGVKGLLVAPIIRAMSKADLSAQWVEMPPARQTEEIRRAEGPVCGLGWFKRPEREEFAVFTAPIYRDKPSVVVARKDDARFAAPAALQFLFADRSAKLIVKTGYSYGAVIDAWILRQHPDAEETAVGNEAILNMIANGRRDYVIMAAEEAEYLLKRDAAFGEKLQAVTLTDAPEGEQRYLMCSKATPADTLARLNAALTDPANW